MSARYVVRAVPYGLTHSPDLNARFSVVDTTPEIEAFETPAGVVMTEERAPPWRTVAWCQKEQHAKDAALGLNVLDILHKEAPFDFRDLMSDPNHIRDMLHNGV